MWQQGLSEKCKESSWKWLKSAGCVAQNERTFFFGTEEVFINMGISRNKFQKKIQIFFAILQIFSKQIKKILDSIFLKILNYVSIILDTFFDTAKK